MKAAYDKFARQYQRSKTLPFRQYIEWYTYKKLLGNVSGLSVLDLACGDGFYSRRIMEQGAGRVVGVDISRVMLELARKKNKTAAGAIEYIKGDVLAQKKYGDFDLVVASYLLNYARTAEQMSDMCRTIAINLKSGGRFVSINNNPDQSPATFVFCSKYGFTKAISEPLQNGTTIRYEFHRGGQEFEFDNYYLSRQIHERAFEENGFKDFRWIKIEVDPEGIRRFGYDYWRDFLLYEPIIGIWSRK